MEVTLFNKERAKLLADIRRLEKMVAIETESTTRKADQVREKKNGKKSF